MTGAWAFGISGPVQSAQASLVVAMEVSDLVIEADRIVIGEILSAQSAWNAEHTRIATTFMVNVAESWKGGATQTLTIIQPGGTVGDIEMKVVGLPVPVVGERAVFFLENLRGAGTRILGMGQGRRPIRLDRGRWMAAVSGGIPRLAKRGVLMPVSAEPGVPLDDLRVQVRSLLEQVK